MTAPVPPSVPAPAPPAGVPLPAPPAGPPQPPSRTEATRLLCAGAYFDTDFRTRVIEQLVEHEERPVAPSLGVDVLPVLAHALRARRREAQTGVWALLVWLGFIACALTGAGSQTLVPVPWCLAYAALCAVAWFTRGAGAVSLAVFTLDRGAVRQATGGRLKLLLPLAVPLLSALYVLLVAVALFTGRNAWAAVVFPLLLVAVVWSHRDHVIGVMCRELGPAVYPVVPRPTLGDTPQWRRIAGAVDREQHARLTIYDPFRPFVGAGKPYEPWSLAMELVPSGRGPVDAAEAEAGRAAAPRLTGRDVIDLVKPRLVALRESAAASRDRLRDLEIEEFVYLPAGLHRADVSYDPATVEEHVQAAVGEGAEARRHFLRVRVGAWDEQVVVSVLVRVHTQGGMLVLEVVPHVLTPVRPEYRAVDVIAARGRGGGGRETLHALLATPAAGVTAGLSLARTALSVFRTWLTVPQHGFPDGPAASVRELGSVDEVSIFQEMDISRYVKTLQDRITSGVRDALRSAGYATGEFEQKIVNVSGGGVYIGAMSGGAVATGERASAKHVRQSRSGKGGPL